MVNKKGFFFKSIKFVMRSIVEFPLLRKYLENLSRCIRRQIKIFQQLQTYSCFNVIGIISIISEQDGKILPLNSYSGTTLSNSLYQTIKEFRGAL